jgi:hypothetical protein
MSRQCSWKKQEERENRPTAVVISSDYDTLHHKCLASMAMYIVYVCIIHTPAAFLCHSDQRKCCLHNRTYVYYNYGQVWLLIIDTYVRALYILLLWEKL